MLLYVQVAGVAASETIYLFIFYWIGWWHHIGESCVVNMFGCCGMWVAAGLPHKSSQLKSGIVARR